MPGQGRNVSVGVSANLGEEQELSISRRPAAVSSSQTSNVSITTVELKKRFCRLISNVDAAELKVTKSGTSMT